MKIHLTVPMAISVRRKCARNIPRTIIPRKLKGPPNDPPLFSSFLSLLFQLFPSFFLVPQRIGIRGANLGGGGPRGEVGQSGGNGGAGQKVGGRRRRRWSKDPTTFARTGPISGNWTIYILFFRWGGAGFV